MLSKIAVGADTVNAARSMMLALGCVQSKACNTNKCPTGIATQDPVRGRAVDIEDKSKRVANYQHGTVHAFLELCGAMGYDDPTDLKPSDLFQRVGMELKHFDQIYTLLRDGQLLQEGIPETYAEDWQRASEERF